MDARDGVLGTVLSPVLAPRLTAGARRIGQLAWQSRKDRQRMGHVSRMTLRNVGGNLMGNLSTHKRSSNNSAKMHLAVAVVSTSVTGLAVVLLGLGVALLRGGQVTKTTYATLCWLSLGLSAFGFVLGVLSRRVLVGKIAVAVSALIILWGVSTLLMKGVPRVDESARNVVPLTVVSDTGSAAVDAPGTPSPFMGDCTVNLAVKGDVLEAHLTAEKDVEGVLMVTYIVTHKDPIVAPLKFQIGKGVSVTKRIDLNWENHGVWLYRVEVFEKNPDRNMLLPVGSVLVERKAWNVHRG